jgi:hypothetical protein
MNYEDSNPENSKFVMEIRRRRDFNNMGQHLPMGDYRKMFTEGQAFEMYSPLWKTIDLFIGDTDFPEDKYWKTFYDGNIESQLMLCPMYVHLRREGFESDFFCT